MLSITKNKMMLMAIMLMGLLLWSVDLNPKKDSYVSDYMGASAVEQVDEVQTSDKPDAKKAVKVIKLKAQKNSEKVDSKAKDLLDIDMIDYEKDFAQASGDKKSPKDDYAVLLERQSKQKKNSEAGSDVEHKKLVAEIKALEKQERASIANDEAFLETDRLQEAKDMAKKLRRYDSLQPNLEKQALKEIREESFVTDRDYKFGYPSDIYEVMQVGTRFELDEAIGE